MATLRDGELETATDMWTALSKDDVTTGELVDRALERAARWQPSINAFSQMWGDDFESLPVTPPLIPLAVKDLFDVAGRETTGCCAAYQGTIAGSEAPVITRVRGRFGFIGKTNQHELAAGGTNLVSACGRTGNPWDATRMTGGSSGGSAAAVAAGIVPVALGSDTGGSIRIPASLCGTFGLKPTTGLLPIEGMMPLAPSMDCPGPIAATAADLELLYLAMGGPYEASPPASDPLRIAVLDGFFTSVVHEEVLGLVQATGAMFQAAGMTVESEDGGGIEDARATWMHVCCPEFAEAHPLLKDPERRKLVSPQPREWLERGERLSVEERRAAAQHREEVGRWYRRRLEGFDALLIPTTPYPAPAADQETVDLGGGRSVQVAQVGPGFITSSVNLAGLPALNLPAGRTSDGLPIGVSLVGPDRGDETLLFLARLWEEASGYRPARPTVSPR